MTKPDNSIIYSKLSAEELEYYRKLPKPSLPYHKIQTLANQSVASPFSGSQRNKRRSMK